MNLSLRLEDIILCSQFLVPNYFVAHCPCPGGKRHPAGERKKKKKSKYGIKASLYAIKITKQDKQAAEQLAVDHKALWNKCCEMVPHKRLFCTCLLCSNKIPATNPRFRRICTYILSTAILSGLCGSVYCTGHGNTRTVPAPKIKLQNSARDEGGSKAEKVADRYDVCKI